MRKDEVANGSIAPHRQHARVSPRKVAMMMVKKKKGFFDVLEIVTHVKMDF